MESFPQLLTQNKILWRNVPENTDLLMTQDEGWEEKHIAVV